MKTRKLAFWLTVGGVSILAHVGLEIAARYIPSEGLRRLVTFTHCGPGGA